MESSQRERDSRTWFTIPVEGASLSFTSRDSAQSENTEKCQVIRRERSDVRGGRKEGGPPRLTVSQRGRLS